MPSRKDIKRRILSVTTTRQVMKAMDMVAVSKLQKSKAQLEFSEPITNETKRIIDSLKNSEEARENIYIKPRKVKNTAYVVITGDRGLCGSYNTNIAETALSHMKKIKNEKIIAIGLRGRDFFKYHKKNVLHEYSLLSEAAFYEDVHNVGNMLVSLYTSGEIDEVYVAYTKFSSVLSHLPQVFKILPIGSEAEDDYKYNSMKYDGGINSFLDYAVPMYLNAFLYSALVESSTCEQAARVVNMDSAVSSASDIIENLTLTYNRKRQNLITQEISEIVNAVNALESVK